MKKIACVIMIILIAMVIGSFAGCHPIPPELFGIPQTTWDNMSPAEQTQVIYDLSSGVNNEVRLARYS